MLEKSAHTKVVWSFSSQVLDADLARKIIGEKVSALRLVSHGDSEDRMGRFIDEFRQAQRDCAQEYSTAIMADLSEGARAQVAGLETIRELLHGQKIYFKHLQDRAQEVVGVVAQSLFFVASKKWEGLFREGVKVYIGYGNVVLHVKKIQQSTVELEVIQGGQVYPDAEIHIPETRAKRTLQSLDKDFLTKLLSRDIEYLVLPGISDPEEIRTFRASIEGMSKNLPWILLRVDSKQVFDRLEDLMPLVDGLLISRRELSLSTSPASIPMMTKEIIQRANNHAKLVVTASEMLGSMRRSPTPTRAEVSDIANVIQDGSDALMLSEEVTHGPHGSRALAVMRSIIADSELHRNSSLNWMKVKPEIHVEMDAVAYNAYKTAERVKAKAIVCITKTGNTALRLSSYQPPVPIISVTFSKSVAKRLSLVRGVQPLVLEGETPFGEIMPRVIERLLRDSWMKQGDRIVFVSVTLSPVSATGSNLFTVQQLQ